MMSGSARREAPPATAGAVDLSSPERWADECYQRLIVQGLENEGVDPAITGLIAGILHDSAAPSYESLRSALLDRAGGLSPNLAEQARGLVEYLDETVDSNATCLLTETVERARYVRWPNNPATKAKYPEQYFDIFEDFFFREPARFITPDTPIGSAGSCFAARIAHQLQHWNYNYVLEEDDLPEGFPIEQLPKTSYRAASARCGTLFNVPSMRQMVERAFGEWAPDKLFTRGDTGQILDPFRRNSRPADIVEYEADHEAHNAALRRALVKCEVFVLTLGLTEAWYFAHSGAFTSIAPWKIDPILLRRKDLSVDENVAELERLFEVYRRHRPDIKLIISVSPVPLNKTFSSHNHVVVANCRSKSVLRVAAEEFVQRHRESAFYFPSYEMVTQGTRDPWEPDMRHVSSEALGRVMQLFQKMFMVDQKPLPVLGYDPPAPPKKDHIRTFARRLVHPLRSHFGSLRRNRA